jgi:predicted extracellular nuclease
MGAQGRALRDRRRLTWLVCAALLAGAPGAASARDCLEGTGIQALRAGIESGRLAGEQTRLKGVVSGRFPGSDGLNGFFLQQQGRDRPPWGLFVYTPEHAASELPVRGERVSVRGQAGEHQGNPQLEWVREIRSCGHRKPEAVTISPPLSRERRHELAGVLVAIDEPLTVTGHHELQRWGVLQLSVKGRRFHPASGVAGGRDAGFVLDDGSYEREPHPVPYLDSQQGRRVGSRLTRSEGILVRRFGQWRLHPVAEPVFRNANPRVSPPEVPSGAFRMASVNLQNFFPVTQQRGPSDPELRRRREAGIVEALAELDADVIAVQELANNQAAARELRQRLNRAAPGRYRFALGSDAVGNDAIRVALLLRAARVRTLHADVVSGRAHNRPPVRARVTLNGGREINVIAVHFKSRGGCGEDQVCGQQRRRAQARALSGALTGTDGEPVFVLGDFNSYAREQPLRTLAEAGIRPMVAPTLAADQRYTYVHRGQSGMLDFILGNRAADQWPQQGTIWHMGSDEVRGIPDRGPWGATDHDPVILDLLPR